MQRGMPWLAALTLGALTLTGCLSDTPDSNAMPLDAVSDDGADGVTVSITNTMAFQEVVVDAAVHFGIGLYEPTMEVSDTGVIYVTAHTAGVDTTGAPVFFSKDNGTSWAQLPFLDSLETPEPVHGATPPPSDEIFVVAGDDGQLWGVDITLVTFPVNGWCDDGARHCYHNPNAYDEVQAMQTRAGRPCFSLSINDRPWAAYANGTLLMVNNAGGGPVQVGAMEVPPSDYVGIGNPLTGPTWNLCASSGGFIPGIPDVRDDGFFAVPQDQAGTFVVVTGNVADVMSVEERPVFENTHKSASQIGHYGQAVFDATGALFVGAMNNGQYAKGGFQLAVSSDDGANFAVSNFTFDEPVSSIYLDGNKWGEGALVNWGIRHDAGTDWYLGHVHIGIDGQPEIRNASLAVDKGPHASRHVQGAALGPDGRGYMVLSEIEQNTPRLGGDEILGNPLSVVLQASGAAMETQTAD